MARARRRRCAGIPEIAQLGRAAEIKLEYEQDDTDIKAWDQTIIGRNYVLRTTGDDPVTEDELVLRAQASPYVLREVPPGVLVLIASIDQQGNRFEVSVWGFGLHFRAWLVDRFALVATVGEDGRQRPLAPARRPEDWSVIHAEVMRRTYPLAGAPHLEMKLFNTIVDTGGGGTAEDAATDNAFAWWFSMVQGDVATGRAALPATAITLVKGGNKPNAKTLPKPQPDVKRQIKGAPEALLYVPNVNRIKGILNRRLNRKDDGPGYISFPRDVDPMHLAELRAETEVDGVWKREPHRNNETWDLYVYAYTVVLIFGGGDANFGWVPVWAQPPRGAPVRLAGEGIQQPPGTLRQAEGDRNGEPSTEPEAQPTTRLAPARLARPAARPKRGIRMVRSG